MADNSAIDFDEFDNIEDLCSELDAPPAVEIILSDKPEPNLPHPVKPVIRTRGSGSATSILQQRSEQIRDFCQQRQITDICHFTRIENLKGIITEGLLPRAELEKRPTVCRPIFTDELRLDGHTDASCLSISFPNYKMFYQKRRESKDDNLWAVIIYDYSIITRLNCAFTVHNAAAGGSIVADLKTRNSVESLAESFGDFGNIRRNELKIPENYPTNPQSEVLAFEMIPANYIKRVVFFSSSSANKWINENRANYPLNKLTIDKGKYNFRRDFIHWKKESL
ncbi:MAG: DarT ssDNA thymidine ADP-ribosyltransferase family protein [Desulfuromonadaceae bacterium]|nr:DarT ssDNA thymidine ADP-ribosyltransferase family protein [Desulfuromonadaceae bacterium]